MKLVLFSLIQHRKRLSPLLAAPAALLLMQGQAKAILTYNIFESGGNVVFQASGSLNLAGANVIGTKNCGTSGTLPFLAIICTGTNTDGPYYRITGPKSFIGTLSLAPASSVSGMSTQLDGGGNFFAIDHAYTSNTPIASSATFNSQTLASFGFTTTGSIGTWTLDGTNESIQVILGAPAAAVPGPLPLFGAAAALGWSRRLRKRIAAPLSTPPQA